MTVKTLIDHRGGAYVAPSAEEITLYTNGGFLLNGSQLPEYPEDTVYHEDF